VKIGYALLASVLCLALTACSVTVRPPVEIKAGSGGGNGQFCPPGQEKKGNC
jgi:hypothetical protein